MIKICIICIYIMIKVIHDKSIGNFYTYIILFNVTFVIIVI